MREYKGGEIVTADTNGDDYLFEKLNLEIKPGTSNAIVGPSGFGKTTMLMLMVISSL